MEFHRIEKVPPRMRPATRVHHFRPAYMLIGTIAVGLQNAFEVAQELLGTFPPAPQAEIEHHSAPRPAVLPEISLMILPSPVVHLYIHRSFIGLNVTVT